MSPGPLAEVLLGAAAVDPLKYFTAQEIAEWHAYHLPHYVNGVASLVAYLVLFGWLVFFGGSARVKAWCDRTGERLLPRDRSNALLRTIDRVWRDRTWVGAVLFVGAVFSLLAVMFLPADVYFKLVYDKRYGLSTYTVPRFARDYAVNYVTFIVARTVLAFAIYGVIRRLDRWWLPLGLVVAAGSFISGVIDPYRDVLTFEDKPLAEGPARAAIVSVLERAQVQNEGIFVRNASRVTTAIDAYFVGQGPARRVILYDTLVNALTPRELAVGVAHEIGHLKEPRLLPNMATAVLMFVLLFVLDRVLRAMAKRPRFGLSSHSDPAGLPVAFLLVSLLLEVGGPAGAAYSRSLEHKADEFGIDLTGDPEAFISLIVKVARYDKADIEPPAWVRWRASHPSVLERLAFGEEEARKKAGDLLQPPPAAATVESRDPTETPSSPPSPPER